MNKPVTCFLLQAAANRPAVAALPAEQRAATGDAPCRLPQDKVNTDKPTRLTHVPSDDRAGGGHVSR